MNNEIITNDEVMEVTEEIVTANSERDLNVVAARVGVAVLASVLAYKYIVKPIIAKSKKSKKSKEILNDEFVSEEIIECDVENDSEEIE